MRRSLASLGGTLLAGFAVAAGLDLDSPFPAELNHPAIGYAARPEQNAVSELNANLQDRKIRLEFTGPSGYLRSVLDALHVPVESQMVVFSKTSLQQALISTRNPRALYFNDSVAVGWVPGEPFVEVAANDAQQGVVFYTLNQVPAGQPRFIRQDRCLQCHEDYATLGVPGALVRSVFPAPDGTPMRPWGEFVTDHRSPFAQRWGGWFVTGKTGGLPHLGNRTFANSEEARRISKMPDLESLETQFDTSAYLSPYSDVVALLVFNHQMRMINLLTRVAWEIRLAAYGGETGKSTDRSTLVRDAAKEVADYLLFADESPLTGRIQGTSGFTEKFSSQWPKDSQGRSLRQFDLDRRLMRYPCSYMIYSPTFDGLPDEAKAAIYQRLWQILSGDEREAKYARLPLAERRAVVDILRETKAGLPTYFGDVRH